ncbi:MAG: serine/threonine protein kinase [Cyanobacteria bacterium HKST-UBA02]|nr:serine/threonine protein kinase [Cyanobacteria bacterium HKST-UBA02]
MTNVEDNCPSCLKPRQAGQSGSLTQWIAVCRCHEEENLTQQAESLNICFKCGKAIDPGRSGSFTQWIFRPESCRCDVPLRFAAALDSAAESKEAPEFVEEEDLEFLDLPSDQFPVERYRPMSKIGSGGAGSVYLCRDSVLNKDVAVKSLSSVTPAQLITFQREARVTSQLNHPNIVRVFDFGVVDGRIPYMVMDFFDGVSLSRYLEENGALPEELATDVIIQVCQALSKAHGMAIFHRDLKPGNVLVRKREGGLEARLIDFGIAHVGVDRADHTPTMLEGKKVVGTPAYMSPDQIDTGNYDARSEIYSLGCVLYELVTGEQVFTGANALDVVYKHKNEEPPVVRSSTGLDKVIDRCLEKDPELRYQSAEDLAGALRGLEREAPGPQGVQLDIKKGGGKTSPLVAAMVIGGALVSSVVLLSVLGIVDLQKPQKTAVKTGKPEDMDAKMLPELVGQKAPVNEDIPVENRALNDTTILFTGPTAMASFRKEVAENPGKRYLNIALQYANLSDDDIEELVKLNPQALLISGNPRLTDRSCELIARLPFIDRLELEESPKITGKGLAMLDKSPRLAYMSFRNCNLSDTDLASLKPDSPLFKLIVSGNPRLTLAGIEKLSRRKRTLEVVAENCAGIGRPTPAQIQRLYSLANIRLNLVDEGDFDLKKITEDFMLE